MARCQKKRRNLSRGIEKWVWKVNLGTIGEDTEEEKKRGKIETISQMKVMQTEGNGRRGRNGK